MLSWRERRGRDYVNPLANLVNSARGFLNRDWRVRLVHVYREANQVVDCIAGQALRIRMSEEFICNFPRLCGLLLLGDAFGTLFPRFVAV
ncbi:putative non-LTR retroelement reverse transcriptase [Senna tora]|uniref:Putative non-LTR retroelement reverse transcriptase n=1 Tax=Senna tora TaxID=362788 RepID=A0A834WFZ2_9FABA|nr:putative non-LTR retroelement reverse transcriptase [Senna tora]